MSRARDTADQINRINSSAADATAITVDSSENVLIGNTDATPYDRTSGNAIAMGDGLISSAQSGGNAAIFNRMTSDGSIVGFRKGGTSVGAIGVSPDGPAFGTTSQQVAFHPNKLFPCQSYGSALDNTIDLGYSASRFKDAYLSGGIYLGGTTAANKLEDYEEGTWTATADTGTVSTAHTNYVKVGRLVTVAGNIGSFSNRTSGSGVAISGLPFASSSASRTTGAVMIRNTNNTAITAAYITASGTAVEFYGVTTGSFDILQHNELNSSSAELYFTISYYTDL